MWLKKLIESKAKEPINTYTLDVVVPTTILEFDLSRIINNEELNNIIKQYRKEFPKGLEPTSVFAWHSDWKTHLISTEFTNLVTAIESCLDKYYTHLELVDLWINMYDETGSAKRHNHRPAYLSCVYYVEAEEGSSSLIIDDNSEKNNKITVDIKSGKLVVFPGYTYHSVPENNKKRTSIALNFFITSHNPTQEQIEERKKLCRGTDV
jgi:hypothetical protein